MIRFLGKLCATRWFALTVLTILFLSLSLRFRIATPLFETPDEPSHFAVVRYIAEHRRLPPFPTNIRTGPVPLIQPDVPAYFAPPLYYFIGAMVVADLEMEGFTTAVYPNPDFARQRGINFIDNYSSKNMYVHTSEQREPRSGWANAMWRLRGLSLLLMLSSVWATYLTGRLLWSESRRELPWLAAGIVGLNSSFLYLSNGISNDVLLIPICSWSILLMISLGKRPYQRWDWRLVGLIGLLVAGLLTKQTAVILLPPFFYLLLRRDSSNQTRMAWLLSSGLIIGLVGGSWYLYNLWQTNDLLAFSTHMPLPPMSFVDRLRFLFGQLVGTFKSFWAAFGWATIFVESGWYLLFATMTVMGLGGWLLPGKSWNRGSTAVLWLTIVGNVALLLYWQWRTAAPYGRLLYPAITPIALIMIEGIRRLLWRMNFSWLRGVAVTAILLPLLYLAIVTPEQWLLPAFASPVVAEEDEMTTVSAQFGDGITLVGYTAVPETVFPGETIHLTLFWRASQSINQNYNLSLQMSPSDATQQVAALTHWLGTARYPTTFWQVGELIRQEVWLTVDETAVAPSLLWINVRVQMEDGESMPLMVDGIVIEDGLLRLGPLRLRSLVGETAVPTFPVDYTLADEAIRLTGYETKWSSTNRQLAVTLFWKSEKHHPVDQTVFVHLLNEDGDSVTQVDRPPLHGNYPTSWWVPNDQIVESYVLTIPETVNPTELTLFIGMYVPATGERLPVVNDQGVPQPEHAIRLPLPSKSPNPTNR